MNKLQIYWEGTKISFQYSSELQEKMHNLLCKCGHKLYLHGFVSHGGVVGILSYYMSQCTSCEFGICEKFKLEKGLYLEDNEIEFCEEDWVISYE